MARKVRTVLLALGTSLLWSCGALRPAKTPIRSVTIHDGGSGRCMAVLLPGRFAAPESFAKGRFGEAVAARGMAIDLVAVDAHLGYYRARNVIERVRQDVVLPARAKGYEQIWLVGPSLGGLGSLIYLKDHPEDISGVLLIAPFLGQEEVIREIEAAGAPRQWTPPAQVGEDDIGRILWSWIVTTDLARGDVPVHLGWGMSDDFDRSNRLLASLLPAERAFPVPGGHDMKTWNRVWEEFLDRAKPCGR